jgi:hypothetical protein
MFWLSNAAKTNRFFMQNHNMTTFYDLPHDLRADVWCRVRRWRFKERCQNVEKLLLISKGRWTFCDISVFDFIAIQMCLDISYDKTIGVTRTIERCKNCHERIYHYGGWTMESEEYTTKWIPTCTGPQNPVNLTLSYLAQLHPP